MKTNNLIAQKLAEFEEKIDNYYINRLAMHEGRAYLHNVVDKIELKSFLKSFAKDLLQSVGEEAGGMKRDRVVAKDCDCVIGDKPDERYEHCRCVIEDYNSTLSDLCIRLKEMENI